MRAPLAEARGLGAAKDGVGHWWAQRVSALALVPLSLWLVASLVAMTGAGHAEVSAWLARPWVAVTLVLTLFATFFHLKLGLQVVVEDYVEGRVARTALELLVTFAAIALGTGAVFAVLKVALGG
ncbi:MAG TPA: succinate dehydrogenase, hydrophobic membrane anchor protein [Alphaproteobacteria bacterium]